MNDTVEFDYEQSLWDTAVLDLIRAGVLAVVATREATEIVMARRKLFNDLGGN